jgi:hypothetical protein
MATEEKTIDQQTFKLNWKVALWAVGSLVIGSNAFTAYQYQIKENEQEIIYERGRTDRKFKNQMIETQQLLHIESLNRDIILLELKLEECNEKRSS